MIKYRITKEEHGELDESLAAHYVETDDGYQVDLDGIGDAEDISGLKSALAKERENVRGAVAKIARLKGQMEAATQVGADTTELEDRVAAAEARAGRFESQLKRTVKDLSVKQAVAGVGGFDEFGILLDKEVKVEVTDEGMTPYVEVKDGDEVERISVLEYAKRIEARAEEERDTGILRLLKPRGRSGTGVTPCSSHRTVRMDLTEKPRRREMTPQEKVDYIREHGDAKFQSLPY